MKWVVDVLWLKHSILYTPVWVDMTIQHWKTNNTPLWGKWNDLLSWFDPGCWRGYSLLIIGYGWRGKKNPKTLSESLQSAWKWKSSRKRRYRTMTALMMLHHWGQDFLGGPEMGVCVFVFVCICTSCSSDCITSVTSWMSVYARLLACVQVHYLQRCVYLLHICMCTVLCTCVWMSL